MFLLLPTACAQSPAFADATARSRSRQGDSFYLDGQFDGFALNLAPGGDDEHQTAGIRINSTAPLHAGSSCAAAPYLCGENGAWVEVTGRCSSPSGVWWAGLFPASAPFMYTIDPEELPGNNTKTPWTPPFMVPAPLKFTTVQCAYNLSKRTDNSTESHLWWLPNTRQPVVLILFSGSPSNAQEAARSQPIAFADAPAPMHLRLGRTAEPGQMRVSWTSSCSESPQVRLGTDPAALSHTISATSATFIPSDLCGEPAKTMGWWEPHWQHTAVIDLTLAGRAPTPRQTFYYQAVGCGLASKIGTFHAPSVGPQTTLTAVLTADLGASTPDRISQHWAEYCAFNTTAGMAALVEHGFEGRPVDLAFNVGDISYATGYLGKWETFMNANQLVSSLVPYMVQMGNHEQDWFGTDTIGPGEGPELGRDSGGECGVPTSARFIMPSATSSSTAAASPGERQFHDDPFWYSFDAGPVHFVMVNTELPLQPTTPQWAWLVRDLTAVNRSLTPWIVAMGHRPNFGMSALEELLWQNGVDLTVAGHVHLAQRSCPLRHGACMTPNATGGYDGVVHVIAGNGGQALNNATNNGFPSAKYPYVGSGCNWNAPGANCTASKKRTGSTQGSGTEFGFSAFVVNTTSLRYAFIGTNDSQVHYEFTLQRTYPRI